MQQTDNVMEFYYLIVTSFIVVMRKTTCHKNDNYSKLRASAPPLWFYCALGCSQVETV